MSLFTKLGNDVFAPTDAGGNPRAVVNQDAQRWGTEVERVIDAAMTSGGGTLFQLKSLLDGNLNFPALTMAWVMNDPTPGNNGIYQKQGASGAGSWVRVADLPYDVIFMTDAGVGTADAIVATSSLPLPSAAFAATLRMMVSQSNAGDVTLAVNGAPAKPLLTNTGHQISAAGLPAGAIVDLVDDGTNFRLLTNEVDAAIVAAAEGFRDGAKEWANNDEDDPVSVDAGGDGSTTFSAKHWAAKAEDVAGSVENPVSYVAQSLTDSQQAQARINIGAQRKIVLPLLDFSSYASGDNWSPAIQQALDEAPQGWKISGEGLAEFEMAAEVSREGWSGIVDLAGARITNMLDEEVGTTASLFRFKGPENTAIGVLDGDFVRGATTFAMTGTMPTAGAVICMTGGASNYPLAVNLSRVREVVGSIVHLDRPAYVTVPSGNAVGIMDPVTVDFGNVYFNFNGDLDDPRYGFGVFITRGRGCKIHDIEADRIGSKVAEHNVCFDSYLDNLISRDAAYRTGGTGGHGYAYRASVCNDMTITRVQGYWQRHTVDLSATSRALIAHCRSAYNTATAYLTHGNGCVDSTWYMNDCFRDQQSAYAFSADGGDLHQTVIGGLVRDTTLLYGRADRTHLIKGVAYRNSGQGSRPMFSPSENTTNELVLQELDADVSYPMLVSVGSGATSIVRLERSTLRGDVANWIGNLSITDHTWKIIFDRCTMSHEVAASIGMQTNSNVTVEFIEPRFTSSLEPTSSGGMFVYAQGPMKVMGGSAEWGAPGTGFIFGANANSDFEIDGNFRARNANSGLVRRFGGTPKLSIGDVDLGRPGATGTVPFSLVNMEMVHTFGKRARLGYTAAPATGTWADQCVVANETLTAGGPEAFARISGAWKDVGAVGA